MKAIITGARGQDAHYLMMLLARMNISYCTISRFDNPNALASIENAIRFVNAEQPDYVFHFAAKSSTRHDHLHANQLAVVSGTCNLLDACRLYAPDARVFVAGSGLQFKNTGFPICESQSFDASSAYACSRIQSVYLSRYFREKFAMRVFVGYLYGHDSPRRPEYFTSKLIADAAIKAKHDSNFKLFLGDASVVREFAYAGDIVVGIWDFVNQKINGETVWEANICTGDGISIGAWADLAFGYFGLNARDFIEAKEDFEPDYKILVGDPTRIASIGWKSHVTPEKLCEIMLEIDTEQAVLESVFTQARLIEEVKAKTCQK